MNEERSRWSDEVIDQYVQRIESRLDRIDQDIRELRNWFMEA